MKDELVYVRHIVDAITTIEQFTAGHDYASFAKNKLIQDAVIRELEIIGEASKRLSEAFKLSLPDVPWKNIAAMRDKLIHDYFGVNLEAVWKTVHDDLPPLKEVFKSKLL